MSSCRQGYLNTKYLQLKLSYYSTEVIIKWNTNLWSWTTYLEEPKTRKNYIKPEAKNFTKESFDTSIQTIDPSSSDLLILFHVEPSSILAEDLAARERNGRYTYMIRVRQT